MLEKNQDIKLRITSMANNGSGVGRYNGVVVFIPFSAPGDFIDARVVKVLKNHAFAKINGIIEPAQCRTVQDCPSFTRCGGCAFRHIEYSEELSIKHNIVRDCLSRIGNVEADVKRVLASPVTEAYRNKAQLPVFQDEKGLSAGFYARRSHRVVPFEDGCRLHPEDMTELSVSCCRKLTELGVRAYEETTKQGLLRHVILRKSDTDDSVMLALVLNGAHFLFEDVFCDYITDHFPQVKTIIVNKNDRDTNVILGESSRILYGDGFLNDVLAGFTFRLSLSSFFQINRAAAEILYRKIRDYAKPSKNDTLLDLYCGVGSIGLTMARDVKKLIGVEIAESAVSDAKYNASRAGITNASFIAANAKAAACDLTENIDIAVVDPPRKGCELETLLALKKLSPKRIVMVSCNPATLARDLKTLSGFGYAVKEITPVDMFPRTAHVECIALLHYAGC